MKRQETSDENTIAVTATTAAAVARSLFSYLSSLYRILSHLSSQCHSRHRARYFARLSSQCHSRHHVRYFADLSSQC